MKSRDHITSVQEAVSSLAMIAARHVNPRPWIAEILYYSILWTTFDSNTETGSTLYGLSERLAEELGDKPPTIWAVEPESSKGLYGLSVILEASVKLSRRMELFDEELENLMENAVVMIQAEVGT